jgi:uncharacterized protein YqeY
MNASTKVILPPMPKDALCVMLYFMTKHEELKRGIMEAMKAKDTVRLSVYRGLVTAFTNELVSKGKKPDEFLSDEEVMTVIQRTAKQRKDSIDQFAKGGRQDSCSNVSRRNRNGCES